MLAASPTWISMVGAAAASSSIYYPLMDEAAVTMPAAILFPSSRSRTKYITGAAGLAGGDLVLTIKAPISTTADVLEKLGESIIDDLVSNDTGLPISRGAVSPATDPLPGERAAAMDQDSNTGSRSITITLEYGLSV